MKSFPIARKKSPLIIFKIETLNNKTVIVIKFKVIAYIHNWPIQSFSQDYGLTSHTTICRLTSTPNARLLRNFFMAGFARILLRGNRRAAKFFRKYFMAGLFLLRVFSKHLLRGNRQRKKYTAILLGWQYKLVDLGLHFHNVFSQLLAFNIKFTDLGPSFGAPTSLLLTLLGLRAL